jgi:hypothetical protein
MLQESDSEWLRVSYPNLIRNGDGIAGAVEFRAGYRSEGNQFSILGEDAGDGGDAVVLTANFNIRIEERGDKSTSQLPALFVNGVEPTPERHFNQKDKSACLCSPLEEGEFLQPEFNFRLFLEQLVIPFLYGQAFYSSRGRWPWPEYAHGATGILESYSRVHDPATAPACLRLLKQNGSWLRIRSALEQKPYVKGHTRHPQALDGLLQLQRDLRASKILIP